MEVDEISPQVRAVISLDGVKPVSRQPSDMIPRWRFLSLCEHLNYRWQIWMLPHDWNNWIFINLLIFCFHRVRGYIKGSAALENRGWEMVKMLQNNLYKISTGKFKCEKMSHFEEENWKEREKSDQWARKLRWSASSGFVLFSTVPPPKIHDQLHHVIFGEKLDKATFKGEQTLYMGKARSQWRRQNVCRKGAQAG